MRGKVPRVVHQFVGQTRERNSLQQSKHCLHFAPPKRGGTARSTCRGWSLPLGGSGEEWIVSAPPGVIGTRALSTETGHRKVTGPGESSLAGLFLKDPTGLDQTLSTISKPFHRLSAVQAPRCTSPLSGSPEPCRTQATKLTVALQTHV